MRRYNPYLALTLLGLSGCDLIDSLIDKPDDTGITDIHADDVDRDGYTTEEGDCDDRDADLNPGALERCDGIDNNCNDLIDEDPVDGQTYYLDADADGFGDPLSDSIFCENPGAGYVLDNRDCDDSNALAFPGGTEVCDEADNDCDGRIDEAEATDAQIWYYDSDGDGYGSTLLTTVACAPPTGYVDNATDCDDDNPLYNPGVVEDDCTDPNDYNCDGQVEYADRDTDGFPACVDCDDNNPGIGDQLLWYIDNDGDGHGSDAATATQCTPPMGYVSANDDCDDDDENAYPGADELCDTIDNDCDSEVDELGVVDGLTLFKDNDGDGYGNPNLKLLSCDPITDYVENGDDCNDTNAAFNPGEAEDDCTDPNDYNCDGFVNWADDDEDGIAACLDCDDNDDSVAGETDFYPDIDQDGFGDDDNKTSDCAPPTADHIDVGGDCDDTSGLIRPDAREICDGFDNNCNGKVDEQHVCDDPLTDSGNPNESGLLIDTATPCPQGTIADCNGHCSRVDYLGDEYCDDGSEYIDDFACAKFNWDEGDCSAGDTGTTINNCSGGLIPDCNGHCTQPNFVSDGQCDDGSAFVDDLNCKAYNWDGGDCRPPDTADTGSTSPGCPTGQIEDCNGSCTNPSYVGDGECDDGSTYIDDLYCAQFNWDDGDCVPPEETGTYIDTADTAPIPCGPGYTVECDGSACQPGQVTDCNGSCTNPNFAGDGGCDDGSIYIDDLFCAYFGWDGGDCGPIDTGAPLDTSDSAFYDTGDTGLIDSDYAQTGDTAFIDSDFGQTGDTALLDTADSGLSTDTGPFPCGPGYTVDCDGVACQAGQITDCNGSCTNPNFAGDEGCDDGSIFLDDLFCPYFGWDGGDCGPVDTSSPLHTGDSAPTFFDSTVMLDTSYFGGTDTGPFPCGPGYTVACNGQTCAQGEVTDCNGVCTDPTFEGDGGCDDGSIFLDDLYCAYFNWDGGDCPTDSGLFSDSASSPFGGTGIMDTGSSIVEIPLLISEVCDHADTPNARYVEIYNPNPTLSVDLTDWSLQRYANGQITADTVALSGSIAPNDVYVIAYSQAAFDGVFGAGVADQYSGFITGNGNDTYVLTKLGSLIDIYGAFGVDGTGQAWEYTDSVATRLPNSDASVSWTAGEWTISAGATATTPGSH